MSRTAQQVDAHAKRSRFGGVARLYGEDALEQLAGAAVAVVGLGGVGSWTAEALARTGVGRLVLMDLDDVCVSNVNRQAHATDAAVGQAKTSAMATRLKQINPELTVAEEHAFFAPATTHQLFEHNADVVIDAIDRAGTKALLIAECQLRGVRCVTVGGAGGRTDPKGVCTRDLGLAINDPLLARVRKLLRQRHGFPRPQKGRAGARRSDVMGVPCVYSTELPKLSCDLATESDAPSALRLDCAGGYGSSVMVTGTFGFHAAAAAVEAVLRG